MKTLLNVAFGLAISSAVLYTLWHFYGPFGLVFGMPVLAVFAVPMLDIIGGFPKLAARIAMRHYEGRYYAFRGRHMDIDFDANATPWVSTADVRKMIPSLPAEPVLLRLQPGQVRETGDPRLWRITPDGLRVVLTRSSDADVGKFMHWLEMEVAVPARKRLERGMQIR